MDHPRMSIPPYLSYRSALPSNHPLPYSCMRSSDTGGLLKGERVRLLSQPVLLTLDLGGIRPIPPESTAHHGQGGALPCTLRHTSVPSMLDPDADARHCPLHAQAAGLRPCHHTTHGHALRGPHTPEYSTVPTVPHPCPTCSRTGQAGAHGSTSSHSHTRGPVLIQ